MRYATYRSHGTRRSPLCLYGGGVTVLDWLRAFAVRRPHADIAIAVVILAVTLVTTAAGPAGGVLRPWELMLAAVTCGVLAARNRWPFPVLVIATIGAEAYLLHYRGHHGQMVLAAPLIALYTVADTSTNRRRSLIIGGAVVLTFGGLHLLIKPASWLGAENVALGALGALAIAAGTASRHRRAWLMEAEARAVHAEEDREAEAARRVTEERVRIARELHDVLGHHLALIHVQSGVAAHILVPGADPALPLQRAREAVGHISVASKTALAELAVTVGLLRQPGDPSAPTGPVTGLGALAGLLEAFRSYGLIIDEHIGGNPRTLPVTVDLAAYRLIQESLTNVCKHAGPVAVTLRLSYQVDDLLVRIDNAPGGHSAPPGPNAGHGLTGMRERVAALGGTFNAGPLLHGGYRVNACLPLSPAVAT
jgi:signal transduction histidine kinase